MKIFSKPCYTIDCYSVYTFLGSINSNTVDLYSRSNQPFGKGSFKHPVSQWIFKTDLPPWVADYTHLVPSRGEYSLQYELKLISHVKIHTREFTLNSICKFSRILIIRFIRWMHSWTHAELTRQIYRRFITVNAGLMHIVDASVCSNS